MPANTHNERHEKTGLEVPYQYVAVTEDSFRTLTNLADHSLVH